MKKIFILIVSLVLIFTNTVSAAGNVSYDGRADGFIFKPGSSESPSDLFESFKDLVPGDQLTETVQVINNSKEKSTVKVYLKALPVDDESKDFLAQLNMVVKSNGKELFNSSVDKSAGLSDWVLLGELKHQEDVMMDITLSVPIDMNNDYQDKIAYLDWVFKVEDDSGKPAIPKTGIDYFVEDYSIYVVCLVLGIFLYYFYKQYKMKLGNKLR